MRTLFLLLSLFLSANVCGQVLFAPGESTLANDEPTCATELPGSRYAFAISQGMQYTPGTSINTLVVITDENGQVLHKRSFPADTFHVCAPSSLHYVHGRLYLNLRLGNDSLGQNVPIYTALVEMDTNLNLINKHVYQIGDSAQYIYSNHSLIVNNVFYGVYGRVTKFGSHDIVHPVIRAYNLGGLLLRERELDTFFFNPAPFGSEYSIRPIHFSSNHSSLVLAVASGKGTQGTGVGLRTYILSIDTLFNLQKAAPVGCIGNLCQSIISFNAWSVYGLSENRFLAGGIVDSSSHHKYSFLKYDLSGNTPTGGTDFSPSTKSTISDSSYSKVPALNHLSRFDNNLFLVGHTSWAYPAFTSYKNQLIVAKCDTNAQVSWTKYIGGDAHYFPRNILATSDHGCLVLAIKYDATLPTNQFDHYIFKLDGDGNLLGVHSLNTPKSEVRSYPNPANDRYTIELPDGHGYFVRISDMNGKVLFSKESLSGRVSIDVSGYPPGLYSLSIHTKEGALLQVNKLLKN